MRTSKQKSDAAPANLALYKAMSQPLRFSILMILGEREASPKEISEELGEPLNKIAYHVKVLLKAKLIALIDTDKRRGGTQHFYKMVIEPILDTPDAEALSKRERETGTKKIIPKIMGDVTASVHDGEFDSHPARTLLRKLLVLDDEGMRKTAKLSMQFLFDLTETEVESLGRLNERGEEGMNVASATMVFPMGTRRSGESHSKFA